MKIAQIPIGKENPPFIIAEMSGNHNQSLERALCIVDAAADAGVQALKIQTYTADTMTLNLGDEAFMANPAGPWRGKPLYQIYAEAHTPWDWHQPIFERCRKRRIVPFSTPYDATAVAFLEALGVACYKIASFENVDIPLIRLCAATGKPLILSTGMASLAELEDAVSTARQAGCEDLVLLRCTSAYPAPPENSNLRTIPHLRELFDCEVGLSDHAMGIGVAVASVALGATVIEKHLTLARGDGGVDAAFSLEPGEMARLVEETQRAWTALGQVRYGPTPQEQGARVNRRSLYVVRDIMPGEVFTLENIRAIRPGYGLKPKHLDRILGRTAKSRIQRGTPLSWDHIDS